MPRPVRRSLKITANLAGVVALLFCAFPVYWMVNNSFLPRNKIRNPDPTWVPFGGTLDNYRRVLSGGRILSLIHI